MCFQTSKNCCYILLSVLCAPITAMILGITFACVAFEVHTYFYRLRKLQLDNYNIFSSCGLSFIIYFQHIWCITPGIRLCKISCAATRTLMLACAEGIIIPISKALSHFWSGFKIRTQILPEGPDRKDDILIV